MKTAEPWNNVRVTFHISKEAAGRLKQLALKNDELLKQLGILSVQVQGEDTVRLSISDTGGNIRQVIIRPQTSQLPVTGASIPASRGFAQGNDPHEFETILNQIKSGQPFQNFTGYVPPGGQNVFVVPQSPKRPSSRKDKEQRPAKSSHSNEGQNAAGTVNGPAVSGGDNPSARELLATNRDNPHQQSMAEAFGDLGDMRHVDFNDLIGADGSLDNLEIGGKHYNEMVTDILHMDGMGGPQHNTPLGMSLLSGNANQVQSQIGGGNANSTNMIAQNSSDQNTIGVDELLDHIQSIGGESEHGRLNPGNLDLSYSQENNFTNVSGSSPAMQRQMSYPQYSSKGLMHGANSQAMFTNSGRQSVGPINTAVASPIHHGMMGNPNSDSSMHMTGKQFAPGTIDNKSMGPGYGEFNQSFAHCGQDMMGMHKQQMISRPLSAGMIHAPGGMNANWKLPPGQQHQQHLQLNTMQRSPGLSSPKPMNMPYNPALTPTKRSYPGSIAMSQMDAQTVSDGSKVQCMSMASPLLVNLLQTSSSTTMAGQNMNPQLVGSLGEPPRPKKKKQTRKKKLSKQGGFGMTQPDPGLIPSPGMMPGSMATHMSPQHGGVRMQQPQYNNQYGMQPVHSPGQYFHPAQSPMPHGQKGAGMYGHYPNGTNIASPGMLPMGKVSPGHLFNPDQKTSFIETINRSDVGSRMGNNVAMAGQQQVPTPGHSPSGHGQITPNHLSAGAGMFMGNMNMTGTVHHGPRMQAVNGMQHPQMQGRLAPSPGMHQNVRVGGPAMGQQFSMQQQQQHGQYHKQPGSQFQSPPQTPHNLQAPAMYNPQVQSAKPKPPGASPDFMQQDTPPQNIVFNGGDLMRQPGQQQRPLALSGYQKRTAEQMVMMQGNGQDGNAYYHQQVGNTGHPKTHNNVLYHNQAAQIHAAGPNNFNNSNNLEDAMVRRSVAGSSNVTDATVTHFPLTARPKIGQLESGEISALLKGTCNNNSNSLTNTGRMAYPPRTESAGQKSGRAKKSPGSATDGLSSSPGSSHSHTPSPAALKRRLSSSNPPTPLHFDPIGSPTMHHGSRSSTPRLKASGNPGHRPLERQSSASRNQVSPAAQGGITVNGPHHVLSRPGGGRVELGQQYASRPPFQNLPSYPQMSEAGAINREGQTNAAYTHMGSSDAAVLPTQSKFPTAECDLSKFGSADPARPTWTSTVANHGRSPNQTTPDSVRARSQTPAANSFGAIESSNPVNNCLNNVLSRGISPQSTEPASSPCTPVSDMVQGALRTNDSPTFFNNNSRTDDLLSGGGKAKKQPGNSPASALPLQS